MLFLVFADRHHSGGIEQDVRGHEHGVGEKAYVHVLFLSSGFVLELGHALHIAHGRDGLQKPGELGVGGDLRLLEDNRTFRIEAEGDIVRENVQQLLRLALGVVILGQGMKVCQEVEAAVFA